MHRNCGHKPAWKLSGKSDALRFKVCDEHLAWGIRLCGFPALVDAHKPRNMTDEETEVLLDSFDVFNVLGSVVSGNAEVEKKTRPE